MVRLLFPKLRENDSPFRMLMEIGRPPRKARVRKDQMSTLCQQKKIEDAVISLNIKDLSPKRRKMLFAPVNPVRTDNKHRVFRKTFHRPLIIRHPPKRMDPRIMRPLTLRSNMDPHHIVAPQKRSILPFQPIQCLSRRRKYR